MADHEPPIRKAIISISSHVVRGSVGNRAAAFALETLGHRVWSLPTVILPWHPGHGKSTRVAVEDDVFDQIVDDLLRAPWRYEVQGVLSGYLASAGQARAIRRLVDGLRQDKPELLYVCDPVIGDLGGLYVGEEIAVAIRDLLLPLASVATPNRFELAWLAGATAGLNDNQALIEAARQLSCQAVLITSAFPSAHGAIGNLYVDAQRVLLAEHQALPQPPNGLGDLLAAVFLSQRLNGHGADDALQAATASVFEIARRAVERESAELDLAADADVLGAPDAKVTLSALEQGV